MAPWPPLAARYAVTLQRAGQRFVDSRPLQRETWTFYRDAQRIALLKPREEEVWLRDASGIRLQRLFHDERRLVDYSAGELRTLRIDVRWEALGWLFDPSSATLRRTGHGRFAGHMGADHVTLQWDAQHALPRTLRREGPQGRLQLTLLAVVSGREPPPAWPRPSSDRSDYARMDAADFGDLPDDPFVQRLLARDARSGWRPGE